MLFLLAVGLCLPANPALSAAKGLKIITSILPVHSLVAGVMQGLGRPKLLVASGSPHDYVFRPSDARALSQADAVFWIGPQMENFLQSPLKTLATNAAIVELSRVENLKLLKIRSDVSGRVPPTDMHMWLDPDNAKLFIRRIINTLSRKDPANQAVYEANGAYQLQRLAELATEIEDMLGSVGQKKSIFYHDAFQYFEKRFGLQSAGFVSAGSMRAPGAKHVRHLRKLILSGDVGCVLTEPQFAPALIPVLIDDTNVQIGILDPVGTGWTPGPDLYFNMMRKNAQALLDCLGSHSSE